MKQIGATLMFNSACRDLSHFPALFIFIRPCLFRYRSHGSLPFAASLWHVPTCSHAGQLHAILLPFCPPATLCSSSNTKKSAAFLWTLSVEREKCPKPCACFVSASVLLSFFHDACVMMRACRRCILIPLLHDNPGDRKEMRWEPDRGTADCFRPRET